MVPESAPRPSEMARASFTEAKKRGVLTRGPSIRSITEREHDLASSMASKNNNNTLTHTLESVGEGEPGLDSSAKALNVGGSDENGEYKCPWIDLKSDDGETYYWNTETDAVTWEMPEEFRKFRVIFYLYIT